MDGSVYVIIGGDNKSERWENILFGKLEDKKTRAFAGGDATLSFLVFVHSSDNLTLFYVFKEDCLPN